MSPFGYYMKKIGTSRKSGVVWYAYHPADVKPLVKALRAAGGKMAKKFRRKKV